MPRDGLDTGFYLQPPEGCGGIQLCTPESDLPAVLRALELSDGLVTIDSDLRIVSVNQQVCRLFCLAESALVGRHVAEVFGFHGEGRSSYPVGRIQRSMETGEPVKVPAGTVLDNERVQTPVAVTVTPVRGRGGSMKGAVLVIRSAARAAGGQRCGDGFLGVLSRLVGVSGFDSAVDALCEGMTEFTGADCACIHLEHETDTTCRTGGAGCPASCGSRDHPQVRSISDHILSENPPDGGGFTASGSFLMTDCEGQFSPPIQHRTLAMVPIRTEEGIAGILRLADRRPDALSHEDLAYAETAARAVGHAFRHVRLKRALRRSEERYLRLLKSSLDMVAIIADGVIRYCSPRVTEILGLSPGQVTDTQFEQYVHPRYVERMLSELRSTDEEESLQMQQTLLIDRWGRSVPVEINIGATEYDGGPARVVMIRDVRRRDDVKGQLRYHSSYDQLTGVHNRRHFEHALRLLDEGRDFPVSLLVGDLNGLRLTNDAFGHEEGDRLLKKVAGILRSCCRQDDVVARIGGDEFAVILPQATAEEAGRVMDRIRGRCRDGGRNPVQITLSLGAATRESSDEDIMDVFKRAEERMYRNKMLERHSVQSALISSLMKILHEKSLETEEHALRLERMALEVGRRLGLTSSHLDDLALLARLHDIGKITVPDEILFKPEPLTRREWEVIKRHPEVGSRIAQACPELAPVARAILCHHEWYDGNGYPQGLSGEEIPLISRIISVVDAYDVMTNGRPYRECMNHREAAAEISSCAGTQFDPKVTEVFLEAFSQPPEWAEEA